MKNFNFQAMLKHGFLIIPKALLQQQIEDRHMQEGEIEALLKILIKGKSIHTQMFYRIFSKIISHNYIVFRLFFNPYF